MSNYSQRGVEGIFYRTGTTVYEPREQKCDDLILTPKYCVWTTCVPVYSPPHWYANSRCWSKCWFLTVFQVRNGWFLWTNEVFVWNQIFNYSNFCLTHFVAGNLDKQCRSAYSTLLSQFMSLHKFPLTFLFGFLFVCFCGDYCTTRLQN